MGTQGSPVKSYDYLLKFLLVGDSDVGKGEILASLQDGAAESPYGHPAGERRAGGAGLALQEARDCGPARLPRSREAGRPRATQAPPAATPLPT